MPIDGLEDVTVALAKATGLAWLAQTTIPGDGLGGVAATPAASIGVALQARTVGVAPSDGLEGTTGAMGARATWRASSTGAVSCDVLEGAVDALAAPVGTACPTLPKGSVPTDGLVGTTAARAASATYPVRSTGNVIANRSAGACSHATPYGQSNASPQLGLCVKALAIQASVPGTGKHPDAAEHDEGLDGGANNRSAPQAAERASAGRPSSPCSEPLRHALHAGQAKGASSADAGVAVAAKSDSAGVSVERPDAAGGACSLCRVIKPGVGHRRRAPATPGQTRGVVASVEEGDCL